MGLFRKFGLPFTFSKKNNLLGEGIFSNNSVAPNTYKTLAVFELKVEEPRFMGDIPDAKVKFYPFDNLN